MDLWRLYRVLCGAYRIDGFQRVNKGFIEFYGRLILKMVSNRIRKFSGGPVNHL